MAISVSESLDDLIRDWKAVPFERMSDRFVPGDLKLDAEILLVGEAPGEQEDREGKAFVGKAGERLDDTLGKAGLNRGLVSVANVIPRRPDKNREPTAKEILAHKPFVERLVAFHPNLKAVALMGGVALQWKTGQEKIESYRGWEFKEGNVWYLPMLHPAAVLYAMSQLKWFIQDMRWLKTLIDGDVLDTSSETFEIHDTGDTLGPALMPLKESAIAYVDVETAASGGASALWWWDPRVKPVLFSFSWFQNGVADAIVVEANDSTLPVIRNVLAFGPVYWGGSNSLFFDFPLLRRLGLPPVCQNSPLDSYPIARLNDENRGCGLKDLSKQHFGAVGHRPYWGEAQEGAWQSRWGEWPDMNPAERTERVRYSGLDAWLGVRVLAKEVERLKAKPHLVKAYRDLVIPMAQAVEEMNAEGMPLDVGEALLMQADMEGKKASLTEKLSQIVPPDARPQKKVTRHKNKQPYVEYRPVEDINFVSWAQMSHILFKGAGLPSVKKTAKTGSDSSDVFVMLKLLDLEGEAQYPSWVFEVIRGALEIRTCTKTAGYVKALIHASLSSHDGRIHSTFKMGPVTWRLASEEPNLQQLEGKVKELFVAPPGWSFVKFDFTGLEAVGLADHSGDPKLIQRFKVGDDIHWRHATGLVRWDYDSTFASRKEGDNNQIRQAAKVLFFAGSYGAGSAKLADTIRKEFWQAGIGRDVVLRILSERGVDPGKDAYITLADEWRQFLSDEYPTLKKAPWQTADRLRNAVGVPTVRSKLWFERRVPEIFDFDEGFQREAERQAYNFPIQNLSVLAVRAYREIRNLRADLGMENTLRLVVNEHDSNMFLALTEHAEFWSSQAHAAMTEIDWSEWHTEFTVPLGAEGGVYARWS